jgi:UDP-N-acetylglucosamine diphosphorylase/glucosamine-1-phosphate N-acetyltransferase
VERGVEVRHGARLEGPLYVGERSRVLGGHHRYSVFGPRCNLNGEITNAVFLGYANKSHDGFLGHSVLGHWVNLGAGTTTSNLKNTYGSVSLDLAGDRIATGRQFLGSLIGDHAKTAIGTLLSTGTVIGAGANVFGAVQPPRDVPPFAWGVTGSERLTEEGFLKVAERVMPRRDVAFTPERRASLAATYRRLAR